MPSFRPTLLVAGVVALSFPSASGSPPAPVTDPSWLKLFAPGKLDLTYSHREKPEEDRHNAFLWSPVFKGGGGLIDPRLGVPVRYGGAYCRPLAAWPELGDMILGAHAVQSQLRDDYELQGEYRFPFGLGFGGGMVDTENPATDVVFGKVTFRKSSKTWNYILEVQAQTFGETTSLGGYAAIYSEQHMLVAGTDGEQWRVTGGYIAPESSKKIRPAGELIYIDNSIGHFNGPKVLFGTASLKYKGGFLSHAARLGRAMGPQGLEFGNPLGFLAPTWNRRLELWEVGGLATARIERIKVPDGSVTERYEALVYPFQLWGTSGVLDGIFVGGAYVANPQRKTGTLMAGYFGGGDFARGFVSVEHEFSPSETTLALGLQFPF